MTKLMSHDFDYFSFLQPAMTLPLAKCLKFSLGKKVSQVYDPTMCEVHDLKSTIVSWRTSRQQLSDRKRHFTLLHRKKRHLCGVYTINKGAHAFRSLIGCWKCPRLLLVAKKLMTFVNSAVMLTPEGAHDITAVILNSGCCQTGRTACLNWVNIGLALARGGVCARVHCWLTPSRMTWE